jgi:tetratricopeptide (TPR) repeat protein
MKREMYGLLVVCLALAARAVAQVNGPVPGPPAGGATPTDTARYAALLNTAKGFYAASEPDSAISYAAQVVAQAGQEQPYYLARAHMFLANSYLAMGHYPLALENNLLSLEYFTQMGDSLGMAGQYNNIGGVYQHQGKYDPAMAYFERAYRLMERQGLWKNTAVPLTGMAELYKLQKKYDQALEYNRKALVVREKTGWKRGIGVSKHNIGEIYMLMGKPEEGLRYLREGLAIDQELGLVQDLAIDHQVMGRAYLAMGKPAEAVAQANLSLGYAARAHAREEARDANELLYLCYKKLGNPAKALYHHERFVAYKDSLLNQAGIERIKELEKNVELAGQRLALEKLQKENERRQQQQNLIVVGLVLSVMLGVLSIAYLRNRSRTKRLLYQKKLAEIAHLNSHQTRAPLATLLGLLNVIDKENIHGEYNQEIMAKMEENAQKLDTVIRDINQKTY